MRIPSLALLLSSAVVLCACGKETTTTGKSASPSATGNAGATTAPPSVSSAAPVALTDPSVVFAENPTWQDDRKKFEYAGTNKSSKALASLSALFCTYDAKKKKLLGSNQLETTFDVPAKPGAPFTTTATMWDDAKNQTIDDPKGMTVKLSVRHATFVDSSRYDNPVQTCPKSL